MAYKVRERDDHFANDGTPKRILALDGGGLRGILTLGYLEEVEALLSKRYARPDFRLSHYFDLIAGTSTGAIIAAGLAKGWTVGELIEKYLKLGNEIFERSFFRQGLFRAKYDATALTTKLKELLGEGVRMRGNELETGLLVVTKRLDSGSPWPIGNNPRGKYFETSPESKAMANGDYPLWQVVRASTAAPTFFDSESMTIIEGKEGRASVTGTFVDGGVSPFNNPSLQALMYATLDGYRIGWPTGADKLLLVSVGTGSRDPKVTPLKIDVAAGQGVQSLAALMDDCASLMETLLQWMSTTTTARRIDSEIGDLRNDRIADRPLLTYLRYNLELTEKPVHELLPDLPDDKIGDLSAMDAPENMQTLLALGRKSGKRLVHGEDFPAGFDLG